MLRFACSRRLIIEQKWSGEGRFAYENAPNNLFRTHLASSRLPGEGRIAYENAPNSLFRTHLVSSRSPGEGRFAYENASFPDFVGNH